MATPPIATFTLEKDMRGTKSSLTRTVLCGALLVGFSHLASAADESITIVSRTYASPGREAEMEARLIRLAAFVRKAEPNVTYRLLHSKKDPTVFSFYEVYPSPAVAQEHVKVTLAAFVKENGPWAEGLVARPMEFEVFRALTD